MDSPPTSLPPPTSPEESSSLLENPQWTELLISFCDWTTVILCVVCKVPQLLKIRETRSVQGLSATSLELELLTYVISLAYNYNRGYPLSSYLEDPFLSIQTLLVLLLVYKLNNEMTITKIGALGGGAAVFTALAMGYSPHPATLTLMLTSTLPMKIISKLLQLKEIWTRKSAGSISLVSWAINIYTCITRIVTTLLVTGDTTILVKHAISVTLNSTVIAAALFYGNKGDGQEQQLISNGKEEGEESVNKNGSKNGNNKKNNKNKKKKNK